MRSLVVLSVAIFGCCLAQQSAAPQKQVRLDDIERDNLDSARKAQQQKQFLAPGAQYQPQLQYQGAPQRYLLPQFYFQQGAPQLNYNAVPYMIIPTQSAGQFILPPEAYQQIQQVPLHTQPQIVALPQPQQYYPLTQQGQQLYLPQPQQVLQVPPQVQPQQLQQPQQPLQAPIRYQQPEQQYQRPAQYIQQPTGAYQQQITYQQPSQYNPYNAIYQQQQKFAAGVKSTPATPLKQDIQPGQQHLTSYVNYKPSF